MVFFKKEFGKPIPPVAPPIVPVETTTTTTTTTTTPTPGSKQIKFNLGILSLRTNFYDTIYKFSFNSGEWELVTMVSTKPVHCNMWRGDSVQNKVK